MSGARQLDRPATLSRSGQRRPAAAAGNAVYALLADGRTAEIRHARRQDEDAVREMHAQLSPDHLYLRFFSLSQYSAAREAKRVCRQPDEDHEALLAWLDDQLIGVASYERTGDPGTAEIAFAVADRMHGHGVATLLLEHLISIARSQRVRAFTAQTLAENSAMLRVFADAGLPARRTSCDGQVALTFTLPADGADPSLEQYLDAVASRESYADVASLRHLLEPASIAVVGAGRQRGTVGREILRNIVTGGFAGAVYPVNPRVRSVEGLPCLPSAADLPRDVDLAVIAVPAASVLDVVAQCGRRGVRSVVVVSSGFGPDGADLLSVCRRYGMRLVGPNCLGVAVPGLALNATFAAGHPVPGVAGVVAQSGGIGASLLDSLSRLGIGVSSFASVGDKYDVSGNDLLTWWQQDGQTRLAVLYLESYGSPRKFARTARRVGHQMPVLTVLGGRSAAGQHAAVSHSAAAATPLVTREALFSQAGIIAARGLGELVEAAALLASQPLPAGHRVAIVSNAGGAAVLAADACADNELQVAVFSGAIGRRLAKLLPQGAATTGPVDTTAAVGADAFASCLRELAADDGVDAVLAIAVPTALGDLRGALTSVQLAKPLVAVVLDQPEAVRLLRAGGQGLSADHAKLPAMPAVPCYANPEDAARALGHAAAYRAWRNGQQGKVPQLSGVRTADARALISAFLAGQPDGGWLGATAVAELLSCYQIPLVQTRPAATEEEALRAASELGGRVVLKAEAAGVVHKSEAGAVKLDLRGQREVRAAYRELSRTFGSRLSRVLVQPMLAGGVEVLAGVVQEPVFGPLVVFGLGGVATEVLDDRVARLTPLTDVEAAGMIRGIHAAALLLGHRGTPAPDIAALTDLLLRISRLADDLPEVAELDLNPVLARPDGACAVDARVRVTTAQGQDPFLRRLR